MKTANLLILLFVISCSQNSNEYLLNEEFDQNRLGWVEEWSESHHTEIVNGKLLLSSLDTAANYSSNGPRDVSVMWTLPQKWQFSTSIEVIDGGQDAGFGFILYSASLNYEFGMNRKGEIYISEYDYNTRNEVPIIEKNIEELALDYNTPANLDLVVDSTNWEFYINSQKVGEGSFNAKSWESIRLFAKAGGTSMKADYYRLKAL